MSSETGDPPPAARGPRTAVLVIHGIGNQRPLETMRAAADAIYAKDPALCGNRAEGDPALWMTFDRDDEARDVDLSVFTSNDISGGVGAPHYVDFHECYWAHVMSETRFVAVPLWIFDLIRKGPGLMRAGIRPLWPAITAMVTLWIAAFACLLLTAAARAAETGLGPWWGPVLVWSLAAAASAVLCGWRGAAMTAGVLLVAAALNAALMRGVGAGAIAAHPLPLAIGERLDVWAALVLLASFVCANSFVLLTVVGDAARYYRAAPGNIAVRRETRRIAVDRLRALHRDPRYDRIVVVAHSLATVIGYDMLRAYWSEICDCLGGPDADPLFAEQDAADPARADFDPDTWRGAKASLLAALQCLPERKRHNRQRWIVSDFVTLDSPLTHARYLSADGDTRGAMEASFARKQRERELPRDPAMRVGGDGTLFFRVPPDRRAFFHPAGLFGVTRWTNIHFPLRTAIFGDVVGGRVCDVFGRGILDQEVPIRGFSSLSAHTHYFDTSLPGAAHLVALRDAVDLQITRMASPP